MGVLRRSLTVEVFISGLTGENHNVIHMATAVKHFVRPAFDGLILQFMMM